MKKIMIIIGLIGLITYGFSANYITSTYCDGGRFFFTTSEPQYASGSYRYVLPMDDKVRISMILLAMSNNNTVSVSGNTKINDYDTKVDVLYVNP